MVFIFSLFLILHGVVHLLYFCHAQGIFELQAGLKWPKNSWLFHRFFPNGFIKMLAALFSLLSAVLFATAGVFLLLKFESWHSVIIVASVFSTLLFVLFWDGDTNRLNDKGAIGVLINLALLFLLVFVRWPAI